MHRAHLKRHITCILLISMFVMLVNTEAAFCSDQYWPFEPNEDLDWKISDTYYEIVTDDANPDDIEYSERRYDAEQCFAEYEILKTWNHPSGDLRLNVSSYNPHVKHIRVEMHLFSMHAPPFSFVRIWEYTTGNTLRTSIPHVIDPEAKDSTADITYFSGGGKYWIKGINMTEFLEDLGVMGEETPLPPPIMDLINENPIELGQIPAALYNLMGSVNVQFLQEDIDLSPIAQFNYGYGYTSPQVQESELLKEYSLSRFRITPIGEQNMPSSNDDKPDLKMFISNVVGNEFVEAEIPQYFQISSVFSLIMTALSQVVQQMGVIDELPINDTDISEVFNLPLTFGFSIPSGVHIAYSDSSRFLHNILGLGPGFVDSVIVPGVSGQTPDLIGFLGLFLEHPIRPISIINTLMLFSLANTIIFPSDFDLGRFTQTFQHFAEQIEISRPMFFHEQTDVTVMWHMLNNLFNVTEEDGLHSVTIQPLMTLYDFTHGHTSLEFQLTWDNNRKILDSFIFRTFNHITNIEREFGISAVTPTDQTFWEALISNGLTILGILGGGTLTLGVVVYYRKKQTPNETIITQLNQSLYKECDGEDKQFACDFRSFSKNQ